MGVIASHVATTSEGFRANRAAHLAALAEVAEAARAAAAGGGREAAARQEE